MYKLHNIFSLNPNIYQFQVLFSLYILTKNSFPKPFKKSLKKLFFSLLVSYFHNLYHYNL